MKFIAIIITLCTLLSSCQKETALMTVTKHSSEFTTIIEKQSFLEQYVTFRRNYNELEYYLSYSDGGSDRALPANKEWDIRVYAVVPDSELKDWLKGLSPIAQPKFGWTSKIPKAGIKIDDFEWFEGDNVLVGVDRGNQKVLYWNRAF